MKILVTGCTGFVGSALLARIASDPRLSLRGSVRSHQIDLPENVQRVVVGDLAEAVDWSAALSGIDVVVHTAARVHVMKEVVSDPLAIFRRVNVEASLNLANQAAKAGVRRLIFLSSIKVNGEETQPGKPFTTGDAPNPSDAYGISKWEAEEGLKRIAQQTSMEVTVIRPPLIYGPAVKANFLSMMSWLSRGLPLPLGGVLKNRRSLLALDNLVDLIATCVNHPSAGNRTFLASDGEDVSTTELLKRLGDALGRPARLIAIPPSMLTAAAGFVARGAAVRRLIGSLQIDSTATRDLLNWRPPISLNEGLKRTAEDFLREKTF